MHRPAVDSDGHPEVQTAGGELGPLCVTQRGTHRQRGVHRAHLVIGSWEEQEERVATELEQAAPLLCGNGEHGGKDVIQDLGQLLGPHATASARRSDKAVKPEMSTKQSEASISRHRLPAEVRSHSTAGLGR